MKALFEEAVAGRRASDYGKLASKNQAGEIVRYLDIFGKALIHLHRSFFALLGVLLSLNIFLLVYDGCSPSISEVPTLSIDPEARVVEDVADAWIPGDYELPLVGDVDGDGCDDLLVLSNDLQTGTYIIPGPVHDLFGEADASVELLWTEEDGGAPFGCSPDACAMDGDLNDDGLDDLVRGYAAYEDIEGDHRRGGFFVYFAPFSEQMEIDLDGMTADVRFLGEESGDHFGDVVVANGDTNGDGIDDLLVSAPGGCGEYGGVYLYQGPVESDTPYTARICGEFEECWTGSSASFAGDVYGDGGDAILIDTHGCYWQDAHNLTKTYLFDGSVSGNVEVTEANSEMFELISDDICVEPFRTAAAGDLDDDGFADILLNYEAWDCSGGPETSDVIEKGIFLVKGPVSENVDSPATADVALFATDPPAFGYTTPTAGDFNSDGIGDLVVSVYQVGGNTGSGIYVLFGPIETDVSLLDTDIRFVSNCGETDPGCYVRLSSTSGDVDGDGCDDLIVRVTHDYDVPTNYILYGCTENWSLD